MVDSLGKNGAMFLIKIFTMNSNSWRILFFALPALIKYYYNTHVGGAGGNLHIVLDDGNVENDNIEFCRKQSVENDDALGMLICDLLMQYSEEKRNEMYLSGWK